MHSHGNNNNNSCGSFREASTWLTSGGRYMRITKRCIAMVTIRITAVGASEKRQHGRLVVVDT